MDPVEKLGMRLFKIHFTRADKLPGLMILLSVRKRIVMFDDLRVPKNKPKILVHQNSSVEKRKKLVSKYGILTN